MFLKGSQLRILYTVKLLIMLEDKIKIFHTFKYSEHLSFIYSFLGTFWSNVTANEKVKQEEKNCSPGNWIMLRKNFKIQQWCTGPGEQSIQIGAKSPYREVSREREVWKENDMVNCLKGRYWGYNKGQFLRRKVVFTYQKQGCMRSGI